mmetsp:Transcript_29198/g.55357  ORF Transcript_29198/g.55357 Transcript_29198/m.55357 type:complete len:100 (-) Transcript_29198:979-1278(-)
MPQDHREETSFVVRHLRKSLLVHDKGAPRRGLQQKNIDPSPLATQRQTRVGNKQSVAYLSLSLLGKKQRQRLRSIDKVALDWSQPLCKLKPSKELSTLS